ncbi:MAG: indole-3-glycerol phosphate synthase TrpC [Ruminococcus sp.]|jgi:indole-3-glycerol phosphate synthase|nr:indole-3-glycerol phosphate synthase TrpC [Ruminococcus sp.]
MKDILRELADLSRGRVEQDMKKIPFSDMRRLAENISQPPSFYSALKKPGLSFICEVKKASPSKGVIAKDFDYLEIAKEYETAGADAISVLTEPIHFMGSDDYLAEISAAVKTPCLRKDFTVSDYQIYQAKALGASAVLLIVSLLDKSTISSYIEIAKSLKMDGLVECHDEREIETALKAGAKIIGVNNRNLKTFEVDINRSARLRALVPSDALFVSESGVRNAADIKAAKELGADAVLIGEALMRAGDKAKLLREWKEV